MKLALLLENSLSASLIPRLKASVPKAHLCCLGLYAPLNKAYLRGLGVKSILGAEFEAELVGGDEGRARDVDEVVWVRCFGYIAELGGEDWSDFGVEEWVGVHVGEEVVDACWLEGVGGPFGD